jgi:hypothetical protein
MTLVKGELMTLDGSSKIVRNGEIMNMTGTMERGSGHLITLSGY